MCSHSVTFLFFARAFQKHATPRAGKMASCPCAGSRAMPATTAECHENHVPGSLMSILDFRFHVRMFGAPSSMRRVRRIKSRPSAVANRSNADAASHKTQHSHKETAQSCHLAILSTALQPTQCIQCATNASPELGCLMLIRPQGMRLSQRWRHMEHLKRMEHHEH